MSDTEGGYAGRYTTGDMRIPRSVVEPFRQILRKPVRFVRDRLLPMKFAE